MSPARPRRERPAARLIVPAAIELGVLAALAALLLLASPDSTRMWAVNGFRSISPEARLLLVLIAGGAAFLPLLSMRSSFGRRLIVIGTALVIAFPLRERIHFLGDSQIRLRSITAFGAGLMGESLREWTRRLHANPLDIAIDFLTPIGLARSGLSVLQAVSVVSVLLALAYAAGLWRLGTRLAPPGELRFWVCAALATSGALEAFAGYAESSALVLAAAAWWWAEMLAPLRGRAQATRTAVAWFVLFLAHRIAFVALVPQLWRAFGPPLPEDRPHARRHMLVWSLGFAVVAAGIMFAGTGAPQLAADWRNIMGGTASRRFPLLMSPLDAASHLILLAPLAPLALLLAGSRAVREWLARPEALLLMAGAAPLVPLAWLLPLGEAGLGAHRDWDLNLFAGFTVSVVGAALLASLPVQRLRGALAFSFPVLVLIAGGWVAVNADEPASMRRALALASDPGALPAPHRSVLYVYLGQRAMDVGNPRLGAESFDRAFELGGNPRRELLAAEAWMVAGDTAAARSSLVRARSGGPLNPELERAAETLEERLATLVGGPAPTETLSAGPRRVPADSTAAPAGSP